MTRWFVVMTVVISAWTALPARASAQSLGTFTWQLQPYCNVLTVNVTGVAGVYTLEGFDDQCGAATRAPLTGVATPNPDGTIGFGMNLVTSPGGRGVQVEARISIATLAGPWSDSDGNKGTFAFVPNGGTGGAKRPAAGIGRVSVDASQVQLRVSGRCAAGEVIAGVNQDGSVSCSREPLPKLTSGALSLNAYNGVVNGVDFLATSGGPIPVDGPGKRFMWYLGKAAFRVGGVQGSQWDNANVGDFSLGMGYNPMARGRSSVAIGTNTLADADDAIAIGTSVASNAPGAMTLGFNASTSLVAAGSFVYGDRSTANSVVSFLPNEFVVRAAGGTYFYSSPGLSSGVKLAPNANAWSSLSDVNSKEHFRDLDGGDVLAKLARMPIREWNYKAQDAAIRHVGPTAQDFHAAFGLGEDPLRISTIDADGIALAGVSALARENAARAKENDDLRSMVATMATDLAALRAGLAALRDVSVTAAPKR